ncbi:D-alanyl-D-alanine carboxypeptidase, partial [Microbispora triticiradicis]|uniref:D-alanyl-D-alanine carboxypeptidase n=1 Tax=Microbispora triticiradicis TaxID=2200763 RepID=UPI001AD766CD
MTARKPTRVARGAGLVAVVAVTALTAGCVAAAPTETAASSADSVLPYSDVVGLPDAAVEVMNKPEFAMGRWLISVEDLATGETLIDLDANKMAEPGSFVKTYSAGAAWLNWGPDHTIITPVKQSGDV